MAEKGVRILDIQYKFEHLTGPDLDMDAMLRFPVPPDVAVEADLTEAEKGLGVLDI